jgi:hypothetical protein
METLMNTLNPETEKQFDTQAISIWDDDGGFIPDDDNVAADRILICLVEEESESQGCKDKGLAVR